MSWKHANAARRAKTHCKWGHKFTKRTCRVYNGKRTCLTCVAERKRSSLPKYERPIGLPLWF